MTSHLSNLAHSLVFLSDLKPGDKVVCLGPSSCMHTPNLNLSLFETGKVYTAGYHDFLKPGTALFNWRRATSDEIATSLSSVFKIGDWVIFLDVTAPVPAQTAAFDGVTGSIIVNGFTGWFPARRFRHASDDEVAAYLGSQKAAGHNLRDLTVSQVGDGWRLLTTDEIKARDAYANALPYDRQSSITTSVIQMWQDAPSAWDTSSSVRGGNLGVIYRTKLSPSDLAALIAPPVKRKVPMTSDDYPSIFWIRGPGVRQAALVTSVADYGALWTGAPIGWTPERAMEELEYSTDRKTWYPCHKEVV
jgi:hypothetical protein